MFTISVSSTSAGFKEACRLGIHCAFRYIVAADIIKKSLAFTFRLQFAIADAVSSVYRPY